MNITKVPFLPLILSRDTFLFSVDNKLKSFAFSPKLQIGVSVRVIYNVLINYDLQFLKQKFIFF
jgi:hypothetical protein